MEKQFDTMMQDREVKLTEWECDCLIKAIRAVTHAGVHIELAYGLLEKLKDGLNTKPND